MRNNKMMIILIIVISILVIAIIGGILFISISKSKDKSNNIVVKAPSTDENEEDKKAKEVREFNAKFNAYEGEEEISGTIVTSLISEVIMNNNTNEEHQITVTVIGTELEEGTQDTTELTDFQKNIKASQIYSIEIKYDSENGLVSELIFEQLQKVAINPEIQAFNQNFIQYENKKIMGTQVKGELANAIISSNTTNQNHKITMYSGDLKSINDIKDNAVYEIILSYDDEGYLNRIDAIEQEQGNTNNDNNSNNNFEDNVAQDIENQVNDIVLRTFNSNFEPYEGTGRSASQVRALSSTVKSNNSNDPDHQVSLEIPEILDSSIKYSVEIIYGTDGYVSNIIVSEE